MPGDARRRPAGLSLHASRTLHLLVFDAYAAEGRQALRRAGGTEAGRLYEKVLKRLAPGAHVDVLYAADADAALAEGVALSDYDGAVWTGSSLTIHAEGDARVTRQVEWVRATAAVGVPSFGSCWAAQIAALAGGGRCAASPHGREFGVARKIALSREGRAHALYAGKPIVFDAFASHGDEVVELPPDSLLLASNGWSPVQALAVDLGPASFWAVQYHPEYDLHEVAALCTLRMEELVAQGCFRDREEGGRYVEQLETLHRDPARRDLAWQLGLDLDVLDPDVRQREIRNWIESQAQRPR